MRVLYTEDSDFDADLTQRALARSGRDIDLGVATSLAQARRMLAESHFDVLLTDLKLPDGTGLELLAYVREQGLPLAVVVLTGSGDGNAAIAALKAGADDYLIKRDQYLERLPRVLEAAVKRQSKMKARRDRPIRVLSAGAGSELEPMRRHLVQHAPHIRFDSVCEAREVIARLSLPGEDAAVDVLLLDAGMQPSTALELVRHIRLECLLQLPVVMTAGRDSEELASGALHLGVDDYIVQHEGWLYELPSTLEKVHRRAELEREQARLHDTNQRMALLLASSPTIVYSLRREDGRLRTTWASENITRILGYPIAEAVADGWWAEHLHPQDREAALARFPAVFSSGHLSHEYRFRCRNGRDIWVRDELRTVGDTDSATIDIVGSWTDITTDKRAALVSEARAEVLDRLVQVAPLDSILDAIALRMQAIEPDMRVSILLLDDHLGCLRTGAAPSLPDAYNRAVDGLVPGEGVGSCGTAVWSGETVLVSDVLDHPYWADYRPLVEIGNFRSCWSVPFRRDDGRVLGTFAVYQDAPGLPDAGQLSLILEFSRITALAVQKVRAAVALRQAAAVFESTRDGVFITDLDANIVAVNRAFTEITGYSEEEARGQNPRILQSGRHDNAFYKTMWASLLESGYWKGEVWNRRKSGELYQQLLTISTVRDEAGAASHYVSVMTDISQLKRSEAKLDHLAHHDPLTDLPNRLLLQSRVQHAIERAERQREHVALLFIDLDRFKNVNDSLGHPVGDELLVMIANRLRARLREADTLARLGGDEFVLLIESLPAPEDAALVAQTLLELMREPFRLTQGRDIYIGASIGIAVYPEDGSTVTELVQHSDVAMYQAKEAGRGAFRFYAEAMSRAAQDRLHLDTRLRRALENGEFLLHYQPQIDMVSGRVLGAEALIRWIDPEEGLVSPARFIPVAEETGLIVPIGEWVLHTACAQARAWQEAGHDLSIAVNLSARQLQHCDVVPHVAALIEQFELQAGRLELELTESMLAEDLDRTEARLRALKALGVALSIDDFGTGYSSLAYLKRFPIDVLKIDQSFVRDIPQDRNDMEIAATIIAMAHTLKLRVVAEGVETPEQHAFLKERECDAWQGYMFSRPVPADVFEAQFLSGAPSAP
ncbi:EAL domain-containing protein [Methyloversatilis sp.]|uniref:EAL domain-containing protein n=1 Tax=Methyloversatilis sp. TaxID=2569862 RepID=UPI0035B375C9